MWKSKRKSGKDDVVIPVLFGLTVLLWAIPFVSEAQTTTRVSVNQQGGDPNNGSIDPSLSADGRFVAFGSRATNLVAGDGNAMNHIFVYDRQTGITTRVSVNLQGGDPNGWSFTPVLSANGRYVAFESEASNLVAGDGNAVKDMFVYDRQTGTTTRASVNIDGGDPDGVSFGKTLSADGRFVAFGSRATNLVAGDGNGLQDVFVYDQQTGITTRVSETPQGGDSNGTSAGPILTPDGRFVAFGSRATNLVAGGETHGLYIHDRQTGTTTTVDFPPNLEFGGALSANLRYFALQDGPFDIFLYDRKTGSTTQVSKTPQGGDSDGLSFNPTLTPDGRYVVYSSDATNLVAEDGNPAEDVFVYDRQTGTNTLVSVNLQGGDSNGQSGSAAGGFRMALTPNGRYVAFSSFATNLVAGDGNDSVDVFVVDRGPAVVADPGRSDVNADAITDLVWRNTSSGATALWLMNSDGLREEATFPGGAGLEWAIRGVGDANGNGLSDLVWRNMSSGATAIWLMNTSGTRDSATFPGGASLDWAIQDVGDVNNDRYADLVWRNSNSGATAVWLMNASGMREGATFPGGAGLEWIIQSVGDVNGDGPADLVWRNTTSGATAAWLMNDDGLRQVTSFPGGAGLEWVIQGIGDVNGDGPADLVWRNTNTGVTAVWHMNYSGTRQATTFPGGAGLEWVIQQVGDVNGDSRADLVWRNTTSGATAAWLMNSEGLRQETTFPGGAGPEWELRP